MYYTIIVNTTSRGMIGVSKMIKSLSLANYLINIKNDYTSEYNSKEAIDKLLYAKLLET
jgi:hypothetical protein